MLLKHAMYKNILLLEMLLSYFRIFIICIPTQKIISFVHLKQTPVGNCSFKLDFTRPYYISLHKHFRVKKHMFCRSLVTYIAPMPKNYTSPRRFLLTTGFCQDYFGIVVYQWVEKMFHQKVNYVYVTGTILSNYNVLP